MGGNEQLIADFYSAYNARDVAAAVALYAPAGRHSDVAGGRRAEGRPAVEKSLQGFFQLLPDVAFEVREQVLSRNSAVVSYRMRGHLGRDLGAMKTTGKPIVLNGAHVFEFEDGLIAATTDYWNRDEFARQLAA